MVQRLKANQQKQIQGGKITNSYYLNEELEDGTKIDETFMKSQEFVNILGDAYTMDTKGINKGYPILKWQVDN